MTSPSADRKSSLPLLIVCIEARLYWRRVIVERYHSIIRIALEGIICGLRRSIGRGLLVFHVRVHTT
jgi:hypothetical protein